MQNKAEIEFWVCELFGESVYEDWNDAEEPGKEKTKPEVLSRIVCNESSDKICIGATGLDGIYHQFDSYEAYYAGEYFLENYAKHGLTFRMYKVKTNIDVPN
jgi:hypothetical protein